MPGNQPGNIIPVLPPSVDINQYVLRTLADGTGGFTVLNSNDLLGGLNRIARELNEFLERQSLSAAWFYRRISRSSIRIPTT
jgi:hypothetical protein